MATLEMVRLRSKYPNMGRMTVRYAMPLIDAPIDLDAGTDRALREILTDADGTTTPKVDDVVHESVRDDDETAAGKGRQAR
jgi:hypothetical protein